MSAPLIRRCAILALVAILAIGNSAGMQVVAWMSMIVDRVQTESIGEAIVSTLQGVRPCALCKIAKVLAAHEAMAWTHQSPGKAPQQQHLSPAMKWIIDEHWVAPIAGEAHQAQIWPLSRHLADSLAIEPPTPPPRA